MLAQHGTRLAGQPGAAPAAVPPPDEQPLSSAEDLRELLTADAYVVALGSYSPLLLRPLGVRLPVVPA